MNNTIQFLFFVNKKLSLNKQGAQSPVAIPVANNIIADMEVRDEQGLAALIQSVLPKNTKDTVSSIVMLGEDLTFEKDLIIDASHPSIDLTTQTEQFLASVPFDEVAMVTLPNQHGQTVIAVNKHLCESLAHILDQFHIQTIAIIPKRVIGESEDLFQQDPEKLQMQLTQYSFNNYFENQSTLSVQSKGSSPLQVSPEQSAKSNTRLIVLIAFAVVLLGVLLFLIFFNR